MYLYIKNGYMVTLLDYCSDVNGFRCNRIGYKWLHWLQAKSRYNIRAKQGHLHSPYDPFFVYTWHQHLT